MASFSRMLIAPALEIARLPSTLPVWLSVMPPVKVLNVVVLPVGATTAVEASCVSV